MTARGILKTIVEQGLLAVCAVNVPKTETLITIENCIMSSVIDDNKRDLLL